MQTLISGLSDGAIYGLIAMGMSITFYVTRVINFAHGQLLMVAVMVIAEGTLAHWALGLSILLAFVAAAGIAVLTYLIAVRPVIRRNRFNIIWVASTLGVSIILENGAAYFFGSDTVPVPGPAAKRHLHCWRPDHLLAAGPGVLPGAGPRGRLRNVRKRTTLGKVGMAVAFDPEMASAVGVNTNTIAVGRVRPVRRLVRGGGCPARPVLVRQPVHG